MTNISNLPSETDSLDIDIADFDAQLAEAVDEVQAARLTETKVEAAKQNDIAVVGMEKHLSEARAKMEAHRAEISLRQVEIALLERRVAACEAFLGAMKVPDAEPVALEGVGG